MCTCLHFEWTLSYALWCIKHGTVSLYVSEMCDRHNKCEQRSTLWLTADDKLLVSRHIKYSRSVEHDFWIASPAAWNNLPSDIRNKQTLESFKHALKTYYFTLSFPCWQYLFFSLMLLSQPQTLLAYLLDSTSYDILYRHICLFNSNLSGNILLSTISRYGKALLWQFLHYSVIKIIQVIIIIIIIINHHHHYQSY